MGLPPMARLLINRHSAQQHPASARILLLFLLLASATASSAQERVPNSVRTQLNELLAVWQWQAYWQDKSPLVGHQDRLAEGVLLIGEAGTGICSSDLGLCCFYSRVSPSAPLNPEGLEHPATGKPTVKLANEFLARKQAIEQQGLGASVGTSASRPKPGPEERTKTSKELTATNQLDAKLLEAQQVTATVVRFRIPARQVPGRERLPSDDEMRANLFEGVTAGLQGSRSKCKFDNVDIPFISEGDGQLVVLVHGDQCSEVHRLLRWGPTEWRWMDGRPANLRDKQRMGTALWKSIKMPTK